MTDMNYLGNYLKELRLAKGAFSVNGLARAMGIAPSAVSRIETGKNIPKKATLWKMLDTLGASEEEKKRAFLLWRDVKFAWDGKLHTESLGAYVKSLRLRAGMTQEDVAGKSGVNVHCLRHVENDCVKPYCYTIKRLVESLIFNSEEEKDTLIKLFLKGSVNAFGLKESRIASGLTVRKLAELAGITEPYLSDIENGKTMPTYDVLTALIRAM